MTARLFLAPASRSSRPNDPILTSPVSQAVLDSCRLRSPCGVLGRDRHLGSYLGLESITEPPVGGSLSAEELRRRALVHDTLISAGGFGIRSARSKPLHSAATSHAGSPVRPRLDLPDDAEPCDPWHTTHVTGAGCDRTDRSACTHARSHTEGIPHAPAHHRELECCGGHILRSVAGAGNHPDFLVWPVRSLPAGH